MEIEDIRSYALSKKGAGESFPFGTDTLVFKVGGKIFMLMGLDKQPIFFNLKADVDRSASLRERYPQITPAWHMNKTHWNSVNPVGLKEELIKTLIDHSYDLIFNSLSKKTRSEILAATE